HILLSPTERPLAPHERANAWSAAINHVHAGERARVGVTASAVRPRMWTPQIGDDWGTLGGVRVERRRFLYHMAEHVLPRWAEMGVREICTHSLWTSDYTVDRHTTKQASHGLHGDLTVASICAVREHVIDPLWGGIEALAHFT